MPRGSRGKKTITFVLNFLPSQESNTKPYVTAETGKLGVHYVEQPNYGFSVQGAYHIDRTEHAELKSRGVTSSVT
jgi:hypothetical protein